MKHFNLFVFLVLSLLFNALLMQLSPFGEPFFASDCADFYTAAKAWFWGGLPYVDFYDTKGPLVFFLYQLAYSLSPDGTWGIYLLCSLASFFCLFFLYRTALVLRLSRKQAFFALLLCCSALFCYSLFGYGGRVENFALTAVAAIFYSHCRFLYGTENRKKDVLWHGLCLGLTAAAFFLSKFNLCLVPFVSLLLSTYFFWRRWDLRPYALAFFALCAASFFAFCLPFALYLFAQGIADDCFQIYFLLTLKTVENFGLESSLADSGNYRLSRILSYLRFPQLTAWAYTAIFVCLLPPFRRSADGNKARAWENGLSLSILCLSVFLCGLFGDFVYYLLPSSACFIFVCIALMRCLPAQLSLRKSLVLALFCLSLALGCSYGIKTLKASRSGMSEADYQSYRAVAASIASVPRAKVLYYHSLSAGFDIPAAAMPVGPSWIYLNASGEDYILRQEDCIRAGEPDFVYVPDRFAMEEMMQAASYKAIHHIRIAGNGRETATIWKKEK